MIHYGNGDVVMTWQKLSNREILHHSPMKHFAFLHIDIIDNTCGTTQNASLWFSLLGFCQVSLIRSMSNNLKKKLPALTLLLCKPHFTKLSFLATMPKKLLSFGGHLLV